VPVARHLVASALREVGVVADDRFDVELATTEACTNVIDHAGPGDAYEVAVTIGPATCDIRVIDVGRGFDHLTLDSSRAQAPDSERGRGISLMEALTDEVRFESEPDTGTIVHLTKGLHFDDSNPARRLMQEEFTPDELREVEPVDGR
jgi:serine/threonine-protein kinase RsbW